MKLFNSMMTSFSTLHLTGVLDAYDFSQATTIMDVGGGHGRIITEILTNCPGVRGVLFDLPHAFEGGKGTIARAGLADRCDVVSGDFFVSVPAGADTYILSRVIHDWDDETAVAILKIIRAAIAPHGRLILLETMLRPDGGSVYPVLSDLNMLLLTGGCEHLRGRISRGVLLRGVRADQNGSHQISDWHNSDRGKAGLSVEPSGVWPDYCLAQQMRARTPMSA